jgi:hypothetical protein
VRLKEKINNWGNFGGDYLEAFIAMQEMEEMVNGVGAQDEEDIEDNEVYIKFN